jgi:hypothetical protein
VKKRRNLPNCLANTAITLAVRLAGRLPEARENFGLLCLPELHSEKRVIIYANIRV